MLGLNTAATLAGVAFGTMYDSHKGTTNQAESGRDEVPSGLPPEAHADRVDTTHVEHIDEQEHDLECPCGCGGSALVLGVTGKEGRYIASTLDVDSYLANRGRGLL